MTHSNIKDLESIMADLRTVKEQAKIILQVVDMCLTQLESKYGINPQELT